MAVDRCICRNITFAHGLSVARTLGVHTVGALQHHVGIGTNCGRCIPYMQRALMTGEVDLPVLGDAEMEALMERSGIRLLGEEE
jgi:bacterioferritin-associated ferredoxin